MIRTLEDLMASEGFQTDLQTLRERVGWFDTATPDAVIIRWAVRQIAGDATRLERQAVGLAEFERALSEGEEH